MDILDFFDVYNFEHVKAYNHLQEKGFWPKGFISDEIVFITVSWNPILIYRLAEAWVKHILVKENLC